MLETRGNRRTGLSLASISVQVISTKGAVMAEEEMTMANCACDWDEEDEMSLTQFYLSRRRSSSSNFDNRQPHSMVVFNRAETSSSYKQSHASANNDEAKSCPRESADEVQANLNPMIPSFVKTMLPSHVTRGFWLGLPSKFCKAHLPKQDVTVTLVDENEENYFTNYLPRKLGLSGGWKEFAFAHSLVVGDTIVFQLVNPTTFKVHITRVFSQCASDGAIDLLTLDSHPKRTSIEVNDASKSINGCEKFVRKRRRKKTSVSPSLGPSTREKPGSDAEEVEGIRFVDGSVAFKDVKDKKSFLIAVNGLVIDSELGKQDRTKYYQLYRSQGTFLHENLIEGINIKLAAGAISQTVEIADGIKGSRVNPSRDEFAAWDDSLQGLELLGMNVRFLRARLQKLVSIAYDSEEMVGPKQYSEAVASRADVEEEVRNMKAKLANLRSSWKRLDTDKNYAREEYKANAAFPG